MLKHLFCINKAGLNDLRCTVKFTKVFRCANRSLFWKEGFSGMIKRLACSNRLDDLSSLFGVTKYELPNIFNANLDYDTTIPVLSIQ